MRVQHKTVLSNRAESKLMISLNRLFLELSGTGADLHNVILQTQLYILIMTTYFFLMESTWPQ